MAHSRKYVVLPSGCNVYDQLMKGHIDFSAVRCNKERCRRCEDLVRCAKRAWQIMQAPVQSFHLDSCVFDSVTSNKLENDLYE